MAKLLLTLCGILPMLYLGVHGGLEIPCTSKDSFLQGVMSSRTNCLIPLRDSRTGDSLSLDLGIVDLVCCYKPGIEAYIAGFFAFAFLCAACLLILRRCCC